MKHRFLSGISAAALSALLLTGCVADDCYETAHFRFSAPESWKLSRAEYDENSGKSALLSYTLNAVKPNDVLIREYAAEDSRTAEETVRALTETEAASAAVPAYTEMKGLACEAWTGSFESESWTGYPAKFWLTAAKLNGHYLLIQSYNTMEQDVWMSAVSHLLDTLTSTADAG